MNNIDENIRELKNTINEKMNYEFKDLELLKVALTHSSLKNKPEEGFDCDNEKLEFIGDAVLDLIVSNFLLSCPEFSESEGTMTVNRSKLVKENTLYKYALKLNLDEHLLVSPSGKKMNINKHESVLADAFEALIGAIFLDSTYSKVSKAVMYGFEKDFIKILGYKETNYKGKLNEIVTKKKIDFPEYEVVEVKGPDHNRFFKVQLSFSNNKKFYGYGNSIKNAEQHSAKNAIEYLEGNNDVKN